MSTSVRIAFEQRIELLPLSMLLPLKTVSADLKDTSKYKQIARSVAEVGIIVPLVVARPIEQDGPYLLLDGHLRYAVLSDAGTQEVRCLVAQDDEAFTYNKRINRLATIQEHFMIVRAVERGVSEDKLADALNLDIKAIRRRRTMLSGICPEVVDLLKDKSLNPSTFEVLRKMKPMRQIDAAELMSTASNYTASYAKALLAATRQTDLIRAGKREPFQHRRNAASSCSGTKPAARSAIPVSTSPTKSSTTSASAGTTTRWISGGIW